MVLLKYTRAIPCCLMLYCFLLPVFTIVQKMIITYILELTNTRHPLMGYWVIILKTLEEDIYLRQLEEYAQSTSYTLIIQTGIGMPICKM